MDPAWIILWGQIQPHISPPRDGSGPEHPLGTNPAPQTPQRCIKPGASCGAKSSPKHFLGWIQPRASHGARSSPKHPLEMGLNPAKHLLGGIWPQPPCFWGPVTAPPHPLPPAIPGGQTDRHSSSRPLRPDPGQGMSNFIPSLGATTPTPRKWFPFPARPCPHGSWEGTVGEHQGDSMETPRGSMGTS